MSDLAVETPQPAQAPEIDWKAEARKWESRAKENTDALASKEAELRKLAESHDGLTSKVSELEASIAEAEKAKKFAETLSEVANAAGVPADVLRGSTREELEAHAETLKSLIKPAGPIVPTAGDSPASNSADQEREFVRELFGRND